MESSASHPLGSPEPKRLRNWACNVKFPGGNTLLHRFVLDHSHPNHPGSGHYVNAVLLSMSDVPARVVNALNDDGYSALHLAVMKNDLTMAKKLLSCLVNIDVDARCGRASGHTADVRNRDGDTALCIAAESGDLGAVKLLVREGADVNLSSRLGTPLCRAARSGNLTAVEFLISSGADANTAIHDAALSGSLEIVKFLVGSRANLNATDVGGQTPLHYAACRGNLEIATYLIDEGAGLGATGLNGTPLHAAVRWNHLEIVKLLISKRANLLARDTAGWTPLHVAASDGHVDILRLLLDKGADVRARSYRRETPLDLARRNRNQSCMDALQNVRL